MKRSTILILIFFVSILSCRKEFDKFERPEWLEGKLYTQLLTVPEIDSFILCVEKSGYDTIIDISGSYTVFAPDNEAFRNYFSENPEYSSIDDMPLSLISEIAKFHIVQNPWSRNQLKTLDVNGWINTRDPLNDEPWGYKRQTLLREQNRKYWVKYDQDIATIVDSTLSNNYRTVHNPSRKYVPIFFDEYIHLAEITNQDFQFLFNRSYEGGNIYYGSGKLYPDDYFAENGFIYKIDRVVEPMKNTEEILEMSEGVNDYSMFLESIYLFPQFTLNLEETNNQPGADIGLDVPNLYDLDYNDLVFDIHEELTGRDAVNTRNTIRYHYGIMAPTNEAMQSLIDNTVTENSGYPRWPNYNSVPEKIKQIIINSHMSQSPVFFSDMTGGFLNGENDSVFIDPDNVVESIYGSNATFYGISQPVIPRAFSSVTNPVYLRPGFSTVMKAMEFTNILPALKRREANYSLFIMPDTYLANDSSLFMNNNPNNPRQYFALSYITNLEKAESVRRTEFDLTLQLLNHVGVSVPRGFARKEFIETLAGNYIVYNSENHPVTGGPTVTGGVSSVYGYLGDSLINVTPTPLEEPTDNGITYEIDGWFSFPKIRIFDALSSYNDFFNLIRQANLVDEVYYRLNFINETEFYTIFIPSSEALSKFNTDTISQEELQNFIKYHFVRGDHIFTDGNKPSGKYETLRIDETSTMYNTVYSKLDIRTAPDLLSLYDDFGNHIIDIEENESSNIMTGVNISNDVNVENFIINGVLHVIDTVLIKH